MLLLACANWEFFQGVKIYAPCHETNVQNSLRNISPCLYARGHMRPFRHHEVYDEIQHIMQHVYYVFLFFSPRTLDNCFLFSGFIIEEEPLCATVRSVPLVEPVLTGRETRLKPAYNWGLNIV